MIIDICEIKNITPKGCHVFQEQIMSSLRDLDTQCDILL